MQFFYYSLFNYRVRQSFSPVDNVNNIDDKTVHNIDDNTVNNIVNNTVNNFVNNSVTLLY